MSRLLIRCPPGNAPTAGKRADGCFVPPAQCPAWNAVNELACCQGSGIRGMQCPATTARSPDICTSRRRPFARMGPLETGDVELDHLQYGLHDPLRFGGIGIREQFGKHGRDDLPGHAVAVLEPAALLDLAILRKGSPEPIDLGLIRALDLERDGVGVLETPAAVERHEALARERELHHEHAAGLAGDAVHDVLLHAVDARIPQQRDIEIRRLFGLAVEPEAWGYLRHGAILSRAGLKNACARSARG